MVAIGCSRLHKDMRKYGVGSGANKVSEHLVVIQDLGHHTSANPELAFLKNKPTYGSALGLKNMPKHPMANLSKARGLLTTKVVKCLPLEGKLVTDFQMQNRR